MSKKILIFSTAYLPFVDGAEVAIKEMTDRISDIQFELITTKLDRKQPKEQKIGNANVYRIGFGFKTIDKLLLPFLGALKVLALKKKNSYDVFWCVMVSWASGAAYIANFFGKKTPIILTLQEGDSENHLKFRRFGLIHLSWKLALKYGNEVTAISTYLAERAKKLGYKKQVKIIPNGVDTEKFEVRSTSREEREKIREKLGLKENNVALITTSRLVVKNGVEDVIDAMKYLPENVKFVIFGEGYMEKELKLKTRNSKLETRVLFKGPVSHSDLPKYLHASDIFIRPSLSEGMGNSFIEAMATGIPIIGTPVGGIVDFLKDGQTGYFCEPKNPQSIADTVKRVLVDPNKNQVLENAKNLVYEKYDWDKIVLKMKEIFDSI